MNYLDALLPQIVEIGLWAYAIVFVVSVLESTAFFGLIIPGTTVTVFAGFLAAQAILDFGDLLWLVAVGGIVGDAISFWLGRRGIKFFSARDGPALGGKVENKIFTLKHLDAGENFFRRHGDKSIFLARFVGPIRPLVPFVAGLTGVSARKFFFFNVVGGFVSAAAYLAIGYFFGEAWGRAREWFSHLEAALLIVTGALIVGYLIRKKEYQK